MARTLQVERLLTALAPELSKRLRASNNAQVGVLQVVTDLGDAALDISPGGVTVRPANGARGDPATVSAVHLSQQDLTRLAFGTFPTGDLLDRLVTPPDVRARRWLEILFPQRHPYTHLPDWV